MKAEIHYGFKDSRSSDIVFYKFNKKSQKEVEDFKERIANAKYSTCYINHNGLSLENVVELDDLEFQAKQEELLTEHYPINFNNKDLGGVTGTNGKTSVVSFISQICEQKERSSLTIGTLGIYYNGEKQNDFALTTPSYIDIWKTIYSHPDASVVAMELSSHALMQNRIGNLSFKRIGFTSFSQDHLDYHKTMDEYLDAKLLALNLIKERHFLVSESNEELITLFNNKKIPYKLCSNPDESSTVLKVKYNLENYSLALALLGLSSSESFKVKSPPGRFDIIEHDNSYIIIDYAHTPDALKNICLEIKKSFPDKNLITVFGCGGDRDSSKRSLMGDMARTYSDSIIVTSDNPRTEDPLSIIKDVIGNHNDEFELDRKEAIKKGFCRLNKSVLLIAGKGHENYIEINGKRIEYSDKEVVKELISNVKGK